jgi:hypothetical protein
MLIRILRMICVSCTCLLAQQSPQDSQVLPLLTPAEDSINETVRAARAKRFNVRLPYSMLERSPGRVGYPYITKKYAFQPELPLDQVDTVIVGEIMRVQPFLSADGKGLYCEYTVKILDRIKASAPAVVVPGDTLTVVRGGGAARLPDGREVKHHITNDVVPRVGNQYLAFLVYRPSLEGFEYSKLWGIEAGAMKPVYPDDIGRQQRGESQYAGKPLADIVLHLKSTVSR